MAHEAVHQWFGDLLTCREWAHGWLNEGFATYFETVWQESWLGGVYWWSWSSFPDDGGSDDDDYTPRNKPAEDVLRKYYGRP